MDTPSVIITLRPGGASMEPPDGAVAHAVDVACTELFAYDGSLSEVRIFPDGTYSIRRFQIAETFHSKSGAPSGAPRGGGA